jgi:hypothetical protein
MSQRIRVGFGCLLGLLLAGCQGQKDPAYRNDSLGFRLVPPAGWSERIRHDEPVPVIPNQEQLLVQYKRLTAEHPAWLRVSVAELPASMSLAACLAARSPGKNWRPEGTMQEIDCQGQPAGRLTFRGHCGKQDFIAETVAVRRGPHVFFLTGTVPADDATARAQVREAVAGAGWEERNAVVAGR